MVFALDTGIVQSFVSRRNFYQHGCRGFSDSMARETEGCLQYGFVARALGRGCGFVSVFFS